MIDQLETRTGSAVPRHSVREVGRAAAWLALCLLLVATPGCSTDNTIGGLPSGCLTFVPDGDSPLADVTTVANDDSTCDTVQLDLFVSDVEMVWSASFEVHFPSGVTAAAGFEGADSFLQTGANGLLFNQAEVVPGVLEIGISRDASQDIAGVDSGPEGLLISVFFVRLANSGGGDVTLEDANLTFVENAGDPPEAFVPAKTFSGGSFTISPL